MPKIMQRGTDSSGRPIKASAEFWAVWDQCCDELGFTPTIVQGGWQAGGGASASATTHEGDAFDLRLWDRTAAERNRMIHVFRDHACAYWERYESQNFDLHAHMVPGPWASPSPGALNQWQQYLNGTDGLYYAGPDYHYRPSPLVTTPPEDPMADYATQLDRIERKIDASREREVQIRKRVISIDKGLERLEQAVKDDATKEQVRRVRADLAALSAEDAAVE